MKLNNKSNSQKGILRKKSNGTNENKIIKIFNNNTKKATSLKNVKKNCILTNNKIEDNKK